MHAHFGVDTAHLRERDERDGDGQHEQREDRVSQPGVFPGPQLGVLHRQREAAVHRARDDQEDQADGCILHVRAPHIRPARGKHGRREARDYHKRRRPGDLLVERRRSQCDVRRPPFRRRDSSSFATAPDFLAMYGVRRENRAARSSE